MTTQHRKEYLQTKFKERGHKDQKKYRKEHNYKDQAAWRQRLANPDFPFTERHFEIAELLADFKLGVVDREILAENGLRTLMARSYYGKMPIVAQKYCEKRNELVQDALQRVKKTTVLQRMKS